MTYAIITLPSYDEATSVTRAGLLRMSADCNTRWARDDKELELGWTKAEKQMAEIVKKLDYSQQYLDRDRLVQERVHKPILEQQVAWQRMMNSERAVKEKEIRSLIALIEGTRSNDVRQHHAPLCIK